MVDGTGEMDEVVEKVQLPAMLTGVSGADAAGAAVVLQPCWSAQIPAVKQSKTIAIALRDRGEVRPSHIPRILNDLRQVGPNKGKSNPQRRRTTAPACRLEKVRTAAGR
jgi:hypothetical protein